MQSPAGPSGARTFVGRERELAELEAHLAAAASGHGGVVLVGGEPGVGKTRLLDELASRARTRAVTPLWGRCWEEGGAPAYWPWVQVLRALIRRTSIEQLAADLGAQAVLLGPLIPELSSVPVTPTRGAATIGTESEHRRFVLFDAVAACFRVVAAREPVLVLLDDVHAADRPSLRLLAFLARELRGTPVLVICAHRDAEVRATPVLAEALAESSRDGVAVHLAGLPERDVARFVETRVGVRPSDALVTALHRQTAGNPFFLDEVVRVLSAQGRLTLTRTRLGPRLGVPIRIRDAVERRLDPLSEACRGLLDVAAVIGLECSVRQLAALTGVDPATLLGQLDEAVAAGVVTVARGPGGAVRFVHALFREALYDGLPRTRRVELHARVGHMLETEGAPPAELAHHFLEACESGVDVARAAEYARRSAAEATARLAYEDATALLERALQALDLLHPPDPTRRGEILVDLGEARQRMGAFDSARGTLQDAVAIARRLEPERRASLLGRAALALAGTGPEVGRVDASLVSLLEEALHVLEPGDGSLRARLLARLACELSYAPGDERRHQLGEEAVAMAERVGDPTTLGYVLGRRHVVLMEPGNAHQREALATSILELAHRIGDREMAAEGRGWRVFAHLELGDLAGAEHDLDTLSHLAEETRHPHYRWLATMFRAMRALLTVRFEDAERLATEALALGQQHGNPNALVAYGSQLYVLRWGQGRLGEIEPQVRDFAAQHAAAPVWESAAAHLQAMLGWTDDARRRFEPAYDVFLGLPRDVTWLPHLSLLAETCAVVDDRARAAVLYDLLAPFADQYLIAGPGAACFGAAARVTGLLAATLERWDDALAHLDAAVKLNERMGALAWVAQSVSDRARVLVARSAPGDREVAGACLAQARALAARLDLRAVATATETLAARLGAEVEPSDDALPRQVLRQEGDHWTLEYQRREFHLRDSKGMRLLAHLMRHPGREFHAAALVALADGRPDPSDVAMGLEESERHRVSVTRAIHGLLDRVATAHPALGEHLERTIRTGTLCSYTPDPRVPTTWRD